MCSKYVDGSSKYKTYAKFASIASWAVNWFLLFIKAYAAIESNSKSVIASLCDSGADLASQAILSLAEYFKGKKSEKYPVGRDRLEDMSVFACAAIMIVISIEIVQESAIAIDDGFRGIYSRFSFGPIDLTILVIGIALKFILWLYCGWANKYLRSDAIEALTEDHFNDLLSNTAAITAAIIAAHVTGTWWVDPFGAILLMLFIAWRWGCIIYEQMKKIVGHTAPEEFINNIDEICRKHHPQLVPDCITVYHCGVKYIVEIELVLPENMSFPETVEIAKQLKDKVEDKEEVARCHIHVDYASRDALFHKTERELGLKRNKRPPTEQKSSGTCAAQLRRKSTSRPSMPRQRSYFGKLDL